MLYKLFDNVHEDVGNFMTANKTLEESLEKINQVMAILDTDAWQGRSKDAAVDLMSILKQYHEKLLSVVEDNLSTMIDLENNASEYMQNGKMPSIWK